MFKIRLIILLVLVTLVGGILLVFNWLDSVTSDKPIGTYRSSLTIKEAKKSRSWVANYSLVESKSANYSLNEIWMEKNRNNPKDFGFESSYDYILNLHFKKLSKKNLPFFQLLGRYDAETEIINQAAYPDGYMRVRFLFRSLNDTIRLQVQESDPKDSTSWQIDTLVLIRK